MTAARQGWCIIMLCFPVSDLSTRSESSQCHGRIWLLEVCYWMCSYTPGHGFVDIALRQVVSCYFCCPLVECVRALVN